MSVGVGIELVGLNKERELVERVVGEINSLMGARVGNWHVGLNKERKLVEKVVGENNSLMSGGVGNGLGERPRRNVVPYHAIRRPPLTFPTLKKCMPSEKLGPARSLLWVRPSFMSREHSGMWEFANNVLVGLRGVTGGEGLAETKVVGTPSVVVGQRVACDGGSGDWRLEVMVSEGECEGGFPSVGATRVEPEEVGYWR
ncbi:hypothetical protein ACSQ67_010594 [Phaseolus vulgaris]